MLAPIAANGFTDLPQNSNWTICLATAAAAAALLAEPDWAQALYESCARTLSSNVAANGGSTHYGSAAMYLGMLAATTERHNTAAEHFEDALEANARMGTKPFEAWTRNEYARTLLARREPDDPERAERLLTEAHATAQALGMGGLLERIDQTRLEADTRGYRQAVHFHGPRRG